MWKDCLFHFGKKMEHTSNVDVTTKLHRLMRYVEDHISFLGFLHGTLSGENE